MSNKRLSFSDWYAELMRRHNSGDRAGALEMAQAERDSSPYHPDRIGADETGALEFFYNEKQVWRHPEGTHHVAPFTG